MDNKTVLMVIVAIVLGMLVANMFKEVCGCKVVEGQSCNEDPGCQWAGGLEDTTGITCPQNNPHDVCSRPSSVQIGIYTPNNFNIRPGLSRSDPALWQETVCCQPNAINYAQSQGPQLPAQVNLEAVPNFISQVGQQPPADFGSATNQPDDPSLAATATGGQPLTTLPIPAPVTIGPDGCITGGGSSTPLPTSAEEDSGWIYNSEHAEHFVPSSLDDYDFDYKCAQLTGQAPPPPGSTLTEPLSCSNINICTHLNLQEFPAGPHKRFCMTCCKPDTSVSSGH